MDHPLSVTTFFCFFCIAGLPALAVDEDLEYFTSAYGVEITGVKPIEEYPDPDMYYTAISRQLGIPEKAIEAVSKKYGWKPEDKKTPVTMIKRASITRRWQAMVFRFSMDPATGKPNVKTMEQRMVEIDDSGLIFFEGKLEKGGGENPRRH